MIMKKLFLRILASALCIICFTGSISAAQVPLALGNHARWFDRIDKPQPDYATEFYTWLEANTGIDGLLHDVLPLLHRQQLRAGHLFPVQVDVAHLAVQIAQRRQFKAAGYGNPLVPRLEIQESPHRFITAMVGHPLLVQLFEQLAQGFRL